MELTDKRTGRPLPFGTGHRPAGLMLRAGGTRANLSYGRFYFASSPPTVADRERELVYGEAEVEVKQAFAKARGWRYVLVSDWSQLASNLGAELPAGWLIAGRERHEEEPPEHYFDPDSVEEENRALGTPDAQPVGRSSIANYPSRDRQIGARGI